MKDLKQLKSLVKEWTKKAQNCSYSDVESQTFYSCAQELHDVIFKLENKEVQCTN